MFSIEKCPCFHISAHYLFPCCWEWDSLFFSVICLQESAAGALENIAADDKLSMVVAEVGGLRALVMLGQNCKLVGVKEQVHCL